MADTTTSVPPQIFEHTSRKEWGRSVLLNEIPDMRIYLFEDGAERRFRPDFWGKMEHVDVDSSEALRVDRAARRNQAPTTNASRRSKAPPKKPEITFVEQLTYFTSQFAAGFEDDKYVKKERGDNEPDVDGRKLKEQALDECRAALSEPELKELLAASEFAEVHARVARAYVATKNTMQKSELQRLNEMPEGSKETFALAVYELLYGDRPFAARFDMFIAAHDVVGGATWPMATLPQALVQSNDHIFIKPTFMKKQALIHDIDPHYDTNPNATTYQRFLEGAQKTRTLLQQAGQRPRDLWDVQIFISKTLSPKAIKEATT